MSEQAAGWQGSGVARFHAISLNIRGHSLDAPFTGLQNQTKSSNNKLINMVARACRLSSSMVKQLLFATRIPGHVQPIGRPCGTVMPYATRDVIHVKDMGQQMGYRGPVAA